MCGVGWFAIPGPEAGSGERRERRGGWDPGGMAGFWGGGWGRRGPFRGGRMFEQGDLKYVILKLLEEKPRHGYEIIKELEERSGGSYSPSPGVVYPTLTLLEELGYARATPEEGGKRIFEITDEGRKYLVEHRSTVDEIFDRIAEIGGSFLSGAIVEVSQAFKDVARATFSAAPKHSRDPERMKKIREVLERAAREIDELAKST
jgi:DNA-binding PadR family transcriptional regulator